MTAGITITETNARTAAEIMRAFLEPFDAAEIKVKPSKVSGNRALALHYIDSRLVMDRLDEVVGVNGWQDAYTVLPSGEVECRLSVRIAGEWVTKADVGGQSEQPDEGDRMKAAYSDALKRAAVKFGIGRFLYRLPQQWMDYDPVKKQIVRPQAPPPKPAPTPAAKPAAPANQPPATGAELAARLRKADPSGECLKHVSAAAVKAGYGADADAWTGPALRFACDVAADYFRRPAAAN